VSDVIDETTSDNMLSPEDAVANATARMQEAEAEAARERQARLDAEARAAQAGNAVVGAHTVAVDNALAAEESRLAAARSAYKTARESGDVDAEQVAIEESAAARHRIERLKEQKEQIRRQPTSPAPQSGGMPGAEAQRWLREHPKSQTDPVYRAALSVVHEQAVRAGLPVESPDYFAFAERELSARFGANHGKDEPVTSRPNTPGARRPVASSTATPLHRSGGAGGARGTADVRSLLARLNEITEGDEPITLTDFEEHAQATYPRLDKAEAVARYAKAQEEILGQRQSVQNTGNGRIYRI
jgi:hypothetical protein